MARLGKSFARRGPIYLGSLYFVLSICEQADLSLTEALTADREVDTDAFTKLKPTSSYSSSGEELYLIRQDGAPGVHSQRVTSAMSANCTLA